MSKKDDLSDAEREYGALGLDAGRFENIPRSLQSAGFLQWSARSDRPKRPHNDGDFHVSWSDPDEWMRFDDAAAGASENESWGIGYVNGAENDEFSNGHRATIDLDGAIGPDGELRDWVPSLEPFIEHDAYIEYSVSLADVILGNDTDGAGLHIPIAYAEIPEWWSDSELGDDVHQGVDVLANKFCTVTGVPHPDAGDTVVEYGKWLNEWLAEAYRRIRDEDPPRDGKLDTSNTTEVTSDRDHSGRTGSTGDAAREDVEAALEYVGYAAPGDNKENALHYNDWIRIAYAVFSWDDGEEGREVFDNWTEDSPKYTEPESKDAVDWIWNNAAPSDDPDDESTITLGWLFHEAKSNGWSGPEHTSVEFDPAAEWASWHEERSSGEVGPDAVIPEAALWHVAEDRGLYDFGALDEDADALPPKAHNKALWWVKNEWADEFLGDDEEATARSYKARDAAVRTWEDVRYIYDDSKDSGRKAARELLSERYEFMTVEGSETLHLYDEERGVFTDKTGPIRGEIYERLGEYWSTHELNEITAGLRQQNVVEPRHLDAGDRDEALLCVANGVLDLFARELREHSPEYNFINRVPVEYDPDAETGTYTEFADSLVDRDADRKALFEMAGHALVPDANERYKKFLILTGDADNGKSMYYHAVETLLNGPDSEESNTAGVKLAKLAQNRFSIYSMYGALANVAGEIDGKKIRNTANLKDITGGDEVEIEPKGQDSFFDTIGTTLMFAANDPPILGERDKKAIATRIVPVELPYTFVEDPDPEDSLQKQRKPENELKAELEDPEALSGFLNLALDGLERLEANGGDVSLPESPEDRLERYERSADPMREFGNVALENDPDDYVVKADVTTLYKEFASRQGYEVGSNIGPVLHGVLRGLQSVNYTDSKPRSPDYTDTSLPLKGWDDRKEVVDRVTLSEKGLELAESAGLVAEDPAQPSDSDSGPADVAFGARPVDSVARTATGYETVTVEVLKIVDKDNGPSKAVVQDSSSAVDLVRWDDVLPLSEGDTVALQNVQVGTYEGSAQLEYAEGVTEVVEIQDGVGHLEGEPPAEGQDQLNDDADAGAAADGGAEVMNQDIRARIVQETTKRAGTDGVHRDELVDAVATALDVEADRVEREIAEACHDGRIYEPMEDRFKV